MLVAAVMAVAVVNGAATLRAQSDDVPSTVNSYTFSFDFSAPPAEAAELQEVQLHYSADQGKSWRLYRGVPPADGKITFEAAGDGEYWFAVQQIYKDGRRRPSKMEGLTPQRKVIVDTTPPRVDLRPISGGGKIGLEWTIRSEDADLATLRIESRPTGSAGKREWSPVSVSPTRTGRKTWEPEIKGDYELRLRIADRAGNESSPNIFVSSTRSSGALAATNDADGWAEPPAPKGGEGASKRAPLSNASRGAGRLVAESSAPTTPTKPNGTASPSSIQTFYVNRLRFHVNYKVDAIGKSGCKAVQLFWRYPDQDEWQDYGENAGNDPKFKVAVTGEGKYGIRLRAVSGVGLAEEAPQPGAPPQLWVVVDITPPTVQLDVPKVRFSEQPEVAFSWRVSDDNLGGNKVSLSFAAIDGPDAGRWKEIAKNLPDQGQHRWKPPMDSPYRFKVRIDAEDAAGNAAHDETPDAVSIDDSRPRAVAIKVEAAGDSDSGSTSPTSSIQEPHSNAPPAKRPPSLDPDELSPAVEFGKKGAPKAAGKAPPLLP